MINPDPRMRGIVLAFERHVVRGGLGMAKKVGAGDCQRVEPFFGLEILDTFFSMKKVSR
ncbi:MAG: hypothetical protein ACI8X3_002252, partial [Saprospiraceae bacterium]